MGETQSRFMGYAEQINFEWPQAGKDSVVTVQAVDEFKILNLTQLPTMDPPDAPDYMGVIGADNPSHYWRWRDAFFTTTTIVEEETDFVWFNPNAGPYGEVEFAKTKTATVEGPGWQSVGSGYGQSTDTPLVGDDVFGGASLATYGCLILDFVGTPNKLTSTDQSAGDMVESTKGAAEFWFKKTANPGANGSVWASPEVSGVAVRLWNFQLNTTGTVSWITRQVGGGTTTSTTGVLNNDTWYHLVGVRTGGAQILYVNGVQVASSLSSAAWEQASPTVPMYVQNPGTGVTVSVAHQAVYPGIALTAGRVQAHYDAGVNRGFVQQLAGGRISDVLDEVGSIASRFLQAGIRTMVTTFFSGQSVLDGIRTAVGCEAPDGMFFVSRDGTLTFLQQGHRIGAPWNTVQVTFDDDGTDSRYLDTSQNVSDAMIYNIWNVISSRLGSALQTVSDATSIATYGQRQKSISGVPVNSDAQALGMATSYLAKYKDPLDRIPSVKPDMNDSAVALAVLRLELADKIRVIRRPIGGIVAIDQSAWIQKIDETGRPGRPIDMTIGVSPV